MLFKNLRKYMKTIMWAIAIFIVPAFVIWNIGGAVKNRRSGFAGKIFGKKISWKEFIETKRATRNEAWMRYGEKFNESIDLDEQTWTRLILLEEAKKRKIKVSNKELTEHIKTLPIFRFAELTPQNYAEIIARVFQQTPAEFEKGIRDSIKMAKMMEVITNDISVSDAEVKDSYIKEFEQASASYILIVPDDFIELVSLDDPAVIKSYYENNKEKFKTAKQIDTEYIEIKLEKFKDEIEITDQRIKKYYDNNKDKYKRTQDDLDAPVQYKDFSEVKELIRDKLIEKEMYNRASDLSRKIMNKLYDDNADFSSISQEFGINSAQTGPFSMLQEIPNVGLSFPFLKAAFSLKPQEISEVVKTPTAFYIIKLIKEIPPYVPEYEKITGQVKKEYQQTEAEKLALEKAQQLREEISDLINNKNLTFEKAAEKLKLQTKKVENITRSGYVSELGFVEEFTKTVFNSKPKEISPPVKTPRGYCIVQSEEIIPINDEKFEEQKDNYSKRVLARKKSQYLTSWFEQVKQRANPESYLQTDKQPQ